MYFLRINQVNYFGERTKMQKYSTRPRERIYVDTEKNIFLYYWQEI